VQHDGLICLQPDQKYKAVQHSTRNADNSYEMYREVLPRVLLV